MAEEIKKLTVKQQRFVEEYCIDFNATGAATRAGYSDKTAYSIGGALLKNVEVKTAIDEKIKKMTMSAEEAMVRMSDFARGSFQPFLKVNENNDILIDLTTEEARNNIRLIKKIKQTKRTIEEFVDVTTEIEIHDAKDAVSKVLQLNGKLIDRTVTLKSKIEDLSDAEIDETINAVLAKRQPQ